MKERLHLGLFFVLSLCISCSSLKNIKLDPIQLADNSEIQKKEALSEHQLQYWHLLDIVADSIPGMSVLKSYDEILMQKEGKKVVVAIIDSGVDIGHPCLNESIWINRDEIPDNGRDDDNNGYVDDIHGWNFLGNAEKENLEIVRLLKKSPQQSQEYIEYKAIVDSKIAELDPQINMIDTMYKDVKSADSIVQKVLGSPNYSVEDLERIDSEDSQITQAIALLKYMDQNSFDIDDLKEYKDYLHTQKKYHYNVDYEGRSIVGDDPDDFVDRDYGDNRVTGPENSDNSHGTHVSGIVLFSCHPKINPNAEIMVLRAVPDGDEYDKDVALAINYAVDNGAQIINTSFGKSYSPNPQWVYDALKHASENDVLVINAAGNDGANINHDQKPNYIRDHIDGVEFVENFITVGATSLNYNPQQVASFSNYGDSEVDLFAPGQEIFSALPDGKKDFQSGTSMAAPNVTAIAAVIRSYYPKLKAPEIKSILMTSGVPLHNPLNKPSSEEVIDPKEIARSPKLVNLYNALIQSSTSK